MKEISLHYWNESPNMGDEINKIIPEKIFNVKSKKATPYECNAVFCGSLLNDFLYMGRNPFKHVDDKSKEPVQVWGTGFIDSKWNCAKNWRKFSQEFFFRKMVIHAVRGELTLTRIEKSLNRDMTDVVMADPGLLAPYLIDADRINKKYRLGIIPHYTERDMDVFCKMESDDVVFIDVQQDPLKCIKQIAECEFIISSSLHGLIFADSLNIPNCWIKVSDRIRGGSYKFMDYYSSYGIRNVQPNLISKNCQIDLNELKAKYMIRFDDVQRKQELLLKSFPFK